jgi:putative redox protein
MSDGWTEITADWAGEMAFVGKNAAGGSVQVGSLTDKPGVGPMQFLLVGLAGCTGSDIVSILLKKRVALKDIKIKIRAMRATDYPMVWKEIEVTYLIWGEDIKQKDVEQAIQLSEEKYCSVGIMLAKTAKITSTYKILEPGEKAD